MGGGYGRVGCVSMMCVRGVWGRGRGGGWGRGSGCDFGVGDYIEMELLGYYSGRKKYFRSFSYILFNSPKKPSKQ